MIFYHQYIANIKIDPSLQKNELIATARCHPKDKADNRGVLSRRCLKSDVGSRRRPASAVACCKGWKDGYFNLNNDEKMMKETTFEV